MARENVKLTGGPSKASEEAEILITETDDSLKIEIPKHLKVAGMQTEKGNITMATTHGNVTLQSGLNLSINLWQRGGNAKPRRNVTLQ